jgi:hypothetical protein
VISDCLTALCQEPWCFSIDQIASMTDWQIVTLYLDPAIERSKKLQSDHKTPASEPKSVGKRPERSRDEDTGPPGEPGSPEHRNAIVGAFMSVQGLKRDKAIEQYDKQLAQWRLEQQGT